MEKLMSQACPCLGAVFGEDSPVARLRSGGHTEMTPCRSASSDNGSDGGVDDGSFSSRARGWLAAAASPITQFQTRRAEEAAQQARAAVLKEGATMKLITSKGAQPARVVSTLTPALPPTAYPQPQNCQP